METLSESEQDTIWKLLCCCGEYGIHHHQECRNASQLNLPFFLDVNLKNSVFNPYSLFLIHSMIQPQYFKFPSLQSKLWSYLEKAIKITTDYESFFALLQLCDEYPNESCFLSILQTIKKRYIHIPSSFHSSSTSPAIQTLLHYCSFQGLEAEEVIQPSSPSYNQKNYHSWIFDAFELSCRYSIHSLSSNIQDIIR